MVWVASLLMVWVERNWRDNNNKLVLFDQILLYVNIEAIFAILNMSFWMFQNGKFDIFFKFIAKIFIIFMILVFDVFFISNFAIVFWNWLCIKLWRQVSLMEFENLYIHSWLDGDWGKVRKLIQKKFFFQLHFL